jgi:hypothetical protein
MIFGDFEVPLKGWFDVWMKRMTQMHLWNFRVWKLIRPYIIRSLLSLHSYGTVSVPKGLKSAKQL